MFDVTGSAPGASRDHVVQILRDQIAEASTMAVSCDSWSRGRHQQRRDDCNASKKTMGARLEQDHDYASSERRFRRTGILRKLRN
jgi:hypothetical protein